MLTFRQKLNVPADLFSQFGEPVSVMFFDIETTGLSAESNLIYLICAARLENGEPVLYQWFSEGAADEPAVINAFFEFTSGISLLIHFNGDTFDVPFVTKKAETHCIPCPFSDIKQLDLFKLIRRYKDFLGLSHCRQKDVERFLGIYREDMFSGGELIEVYKQYLGRARFDKLTSGTPLAHTPGSGLPSMPRTPSEALLATLLLHNAEDVEGLIKISALYPLLQILQGIVPKGFSSEVENKGRSVSARFMGNTFLPAPLTLGIPTKDRPHISLTAGPGDISIECYAFEGELKHFIEDYKNYYYLPETDTAIHKSAGAGVAKERRKNATAATCYIKKSGAFFPIAPEGKPLLRKDHKSKMLFVDAKEPFLLEESALINAMLNEFRNL
jgi:uncharacterized protein YprB with RNaseH-like and TPR domain